MVAAAEGAAGDGACWGCGGGCLLHGLLALGPVEDGRLIALRTNHGTAGACLPRGRRGQGGARPAGGGLLGNATAPSRRPSSGDRRSRAGGGTDRAEGPLGPRVPNTPLRPGPLLPAAPRAPNPSGAQSSAQQLLERQLTQAPGARADVTPAHVCSRPGARGLAEPPCDGARAPPGSSWQCRGPPSAGASCTDCGPGLRRRARPCRRGGARAAVPGRGGRPSGRRRPSRLATPRRAPLTRAGGSHPRDHFRRVGGQNGGRGETRAPLD